MPTLVEKKILEKMFYDRLIGARHTSADNIPKGFPKHLRGEARKALRSLIRKGLVVAKPTSYGLEVSLNPKRLEEIIEIISRT
ncbi:hypothetical protein DRO58_03645 [Candidatus Bathyarchaeota archaeon]|mgnify:CR=1 FL=1|nr:MAG: hypothetical protein DRO58_03645 [Candidatus Bathyarchaeota archaeon]